MGKSCCSKVVFDEINCFAFPNQLLDSFNVHTAGAVDCILTWIQFTPRYTMIRIRICQQLIIKIRTSMIKKQFPVKFPIPKIINNKPTAWALQCDVSRNNF